MPEDRPEYEKKAEPTTVAFVAVPQWAIDLKISIDAGFKETNANLALVTNELNLVKTRVDLLEKRANDGSIRVRDEVGVNKEQEERIKGLEKSNEVQLAILQRLDKVAANPSIKLILGLIVIILGSYAATKGIVIK